MLSIAWNRSRKSFKILSLAILAGALPVLAAFQVVRAEEGPVQKTFKTPKMAVKALIDAVKAKDLQGVLTVLGPEAKDFVTCGNKTEDDEIRGRFLKATRENTLLVPGGTDKYILNIGKNRWPFAIPIVKEGDAWRFDTAAGREEILNRRIGRNELHTIEVCRAYVDAQREYFSKDRDGDKILEYAQKFTSKPGEKDGLNWEVSRECQECPPVGRMLSEAATQESCPSGEPVPYHGYFFKILAGQGRHAPGGEKSYLDGENMTGGFALLAYPARYGISGIMTFTVNQQGIVFQKDLGEKTEEIAKGVTRYDPDDTWSPVE